MSVDMHCQRTNCPVSTKSKYKSNSTLHPSFYTKFYTQVFTLYTQVFTPSIDIFIEIGNDDKALFIALLFA